MDGVSIATFSEYVVPHRGLDIKGLYELYRHREFCNNVVLCPNVKQL